MLNQINKYTNLFFSDLFEFMCVFFIVICLLVLYLMLSVYLFIFLLKIDRWLNLIGINSSIVKDL